MWHANSFLTRLSSLFGREYVKSECLGVCVCVLKRQNKRTTALFWGWNITRDANKQQWIWAVREACSPNWPHAKPLLVACSPAGCCTAVADPKSSCLCLANRQYLARWISQVKNNSLWRKKSATQNWLLLVKSGSSRGTHRWGTGWRGRSQWKQENRLASAVTGEKWEIPGSPNKTGQHSAGKNSLWKRSFVIIIKVRVALENAYDVMRGKNCTSE